MPCMQGPTAPAQLVSLANAERHCHDRGPLLDYPAVALSIAPRMRAHRSSTLARQSAPGCVNT